MNETADDILVRAALTGDTEPFCALVRRYQDHAYGVALGVLSDVHLALDAAQEAFLCAYCDLPKLKDPARFAGWLCGIARNTAFEIRRQRERQACLVRQAAGQSVLESPPVDQVVAEGEQEAIVRQALLRVSDKDREALTLYYADGLSYGEVCDFLDISMGTLKGRLQRGRAALRKELAMVEQACKDNAPDESFARSLEQAIRVYGAKGPPTHRLPSPWAQSRREETGRILNAGEEGFQVDLALSHSGSARQRGESVIHFGLRRDPKSLLELERVLEDRSARVRREAVKWYAAAIHPGNAEKWKGPFEAGQLVANTARGLDRLLARMSDENFNVRLAALVCVGAYLPAGDEGVTTVLRKALDDPKHKVRHMAARILKVPCRGCGRIW